MEGFLFFNKHTHSNAEVGSQYLYFYKTPLEVENEDVTIKKSKDKEKRYKENKGGMRKEENKKGDWGEGGEGGR